MSSTKVNKHRVGIVGFGNLGKYLVKALQTESHLIAAYEICFVWNRSPDAVLNDPSVKDLYLASLEDVASRKPDIIVEVAHPSITATYGKLFLETGADYFVGSPTCFADAKVEKSILDLVTSETTKNKMGGLYIPSGALWGANDIQKMASRGTLKAVEITMKKHPGSFRIVEGTNVDKILKEYANDPQKEGECQLYHGPIRDLCPQAPNNVNTMACAALASQPCLGFDKATALLVADKSLEAHVIHIDVNGPGGFSVRTVRDNPSKKGAVTGNATYASFLSSLVLAKGRGSGVHFV